MAPVAVPFYLLPFAMKPFWPFSLVQRSQRRRCLSRWAISGATAGSCSRRQAGYRQATEVGLEHQTPEETLRLLQRRIRGIDRRRWHAVAKLRTRMRQVGVEGRHMHVTASTLRLLLRLRRRIMWLDWCRDNTLLYVNLLLRWLEDPRRSS